MPGTTLTMQLVRQPGLFLTPEKTYERKIKEAILAFELEKQFTKEEIFTYYGNQVYCGHGQDFSFTSSQDHTCFD